MFALYFLRYLTLKYRFCYCVKKKGALKSGVVMKQCLKITVQCVNAEKAKKNFIKKKAEEFALQGVVQQPNSDNLIIYVSGVMDHIDDFVDSLYVGTSAYAFNHIEMEPCANRDYRGVFRVVE